MKQIIIFLSFCVTVLLSHGMRQGENASANIISNQQLEAFKVLQYRCNVCHETQNPSKFFTLDNMNDFAKKINRQVFMWKRMPKGKKNNLTQEEEQVLKEWINEQLN